MVDFFFSHKHLNQLIFSMNLGTIAFRFADLDLNLDPSKAGPTYGGVITNLCL